MSLRVHGNWTGPGWSGGKYQLSVPNYTKKTKPVTKWDRESFYHDRIYHQARVNWYTDRRKAADRTYYNKNINKYEVRGRVFGPGRMDRTEQVNQQLAAMAVGAQGLLRPDDTETGLQINRDGGVQTNSSSSKSKVMANGKSRQRTPSRRRSASGGASAYVTPPATRGRSTTRRLSFSAARAVTPRVRSVSMRQRSASRGGGEASAGSVGLIRGGGGFIATSKKSTQAMRKSKLGRIRATGFNATSENGGVVTSTAAQQVICLGHATAPLANLQDAFIGSTVKRVLYKAGITVSDFTSVLSIGDLTDIQFVYTKDAATEFSAPLTETYTCPPAATSLKTICDWFNASGRGWNVASNSQIVQFQVIRTSIRTPAALGSTISAAPVTVWLDKAKISYISKSAMKLQNRTVLGADITAESVSNQPLYGKFYEGNKNGAQCKAVVVGVSVPQFFSRPDGIIYIGGANLTNLGIKEPVSPTILKGASKYGAVDLAPGAVRTSVLNDKGTVGWNVMYKKLFQSMWYKPSSSPTAVAFEVNLGKYRMFMLEKMMQCGVAEGGVLTLGYEVNYDVSMNFKEGRSQEMFISFTTN